MSDLYDNAWTNAYEELEDEMEEKDIIQTLLDMFKVLQLGFFTTIIRCLNLKYAGNISLYFMKRYVYFSTLNSIQILSI